MLNEKQKSAIWLGITIIIAMDFYPPWQEKGGNPSGYAPIYAPPPAIEGHPPLTIDYPRLLLQWSMVGFLVAGLFTTAQEAPSKGSAGKGSAKSSSAEKTSAPVATESKRSDHSKSADFNTVIFSGNRSIGEVLVESEADPDFWEAVGEAQGTLQVPRNRKLQLEVVKTGPVDLAALAPLYKDLFHSIDLSESEVSDEMLKHLVHQTSLEEVDLSHTSITDQGVAALTKLPSLRKLWLDNTKISDSSIASLKEMGKLVKLSLAGTELTESEIKKSKPEFPASCEIVLPNGSIA